MDEPPALAPPALPGAKGGEYVVVARRYRPQTFDELIGQEHVARGLSGAILSHRVGHAYLFTGARGVGKTSAARILAKALNCIHGPTPVPCNECDICRSISSGDDVDVLEIDGASNRGIDEIRQLRQNVNMRPSRARFKLYIIDEVHMLTREAFNALLKTLEEPPEHVKFIFCTTEPEKIPITILSRCQRYDFAGIQSESIARRLRQIAAAEGVEADDDAIALLARRAAGSMRDSQSLLEQLLSLGGKRLTTADVHAMLGTAGGARLDRLVGHLVDHQPAAALAELDTALTEGVDVGQLLDQLLGYFRDVMAAAAGCEPESFLYTDPGGHAQVAAAAQQLGLEAILAVLQILEQTLWRLRFSTQSRTLAELALVRISKLDDLERLSDLIAELRTGIPGASATANAGSQMASSAAAAKKKADLTLSANGSRPAAGALSAPPAPPERVADEKRASDENTAARKRIGIPLGPENALDLFQQAAEKIGGLAASSAQQAEFAAIGAPDQLVVTFPAKYNYGKTICEAANTASQLENALGELVGKPVRLVFAVSEGSSAGSAEPSRPMSARQREELLMQHPLVRRASELFDARPVLRETENRE
jgi:DNA polymerase-3 subunit gamma/tau